MTQLCLFSSPTEVKQRQISGILRIERVSRDIAIAENRYSIVLHRDDDEPLGIPVQLAEIEAHYLQPKLQKELKRGTSWSSLIATAEQLIDENCSKKESAKLTHAPPLLRAQNTTPLTATQMEERNEQN